MIEAGAMGSGGRQTFYGDENNKFRNYGQAKKAGIKNIGKYFKTKDNKFYRFGDSLLGFNHGDKIKHSSLPMVMVSQSRSDALQPLNSSTFKCRPW